MATRTMMKLEPRALRGIAAVILLQSLFFKFTAAPESVYIFPRVHAEPWVRIGSGVVELIAATLLLWPRFSWVAGIAAGLMLGVIASDLTALGIDVQGDGGLLFGLGLTVFTCSSMLQYLFRNNIRFLGKRFL